MSQPHWIEYTIYVGLDAAGGASGGGGLSNTADFDEEAPAILGLTATVSPMAVQGITVVDLSVMFLSVLMVWGFAYTKYTVARWEGALLTLVFVGYMGWLLYNL